MEKVSFAVACKRYFGIKEGELLGGFVKELKALTPEDKGWFAQELTKELGVEVTP